MVETKALADLKVERAAGEGERRKVEADLGPVKYLATLLGALGISIRPDSPRPIPR